MERRWSPRREFPSLVSIECEGVGSISCRAHDISMEGMFIESEQLPPETNAPVRAHFTVEANGRTQTYSINGRVAYRTREGAGIVFREIDVNLCRQLHHVLYPEDKPAA
ncbi:MAG: PilZ domain-containing protein [Gammaproteobacteria bacterium]